MNYTKKLQELQAELDGMVSRNQEIIASAEAEGRNSLTEEERKEIDNNTEVRKPALLAEIRRFTALKSEAEEKAQRAAGDASAKPESPKEVREFSFGGFVKDLAENGRPTGVYREMHEEAVKEARNIGTTVNGAGIPGFILKRDSTVGVTTQGGHSVQTTVSSNFIESLENKMVMPGLGAQFITGLQGDFKIPRVDTAPTATWEGETDAAAETDVTLGQITLSPNRLSGFVQISKQLLLQSVPVYDRFVSDQLVRAFQRGIDDVSINGTGTGEPTGIRNTAGVGAVVMGTNGTLMTYAKLVEFWQTQQAANGTDIALSYLSNAKVKGSMMTITKDSGSGRFLYNDANPEAPLIGYKFAVTNAVPSNLTKGTSVGVCSSMVFGDFNELLIGQWGGIDVLVDPYSSGKSGLIDIVVHMFADVKVRHAASFVVSNDILTV